MPSRTVRTALVLFCLVFGAIGAAALTIAALVCWGLLGLMVGISASLGASEFVTPRMRTGWACSDERWGAVVAGAVVTVCLTIAGLVTVVGPSAAAAVVLAIVVTWAYWRVRHASAARRAASRAVPQPVSAPAQPAATNLSTAELCLAWRRSYVELQKAGCDATRHGVVQRRREYLDELEARNRDGFARWLASGARAGGDPRRYLTAADG